MSHPASLDLVALRSLLPSPRFLTVVATLECFHPIYVNTPSYFALLVTWSMFPYLLDLNQIFTKRNDDNTQLVEGLLAFFILSSSFFFTLCLSLQLWAFSLISRFYLLYSCPISSLDLSSSRWASLHSKAHILRQIIAQ